MERKGEVIDQEALEEEMKNISKENRKNLEPCLPADRSKERNIEFIDTKTDLKTISLSIKTDNIDYQQIDEYITPDLRKKIKDVKLKKESIELNELLKNFEISAKNLSTGFADWKDILKSYLHKKHEADYDKYEKILKQLKLL
jgi:acetone carboxylase gamma subunit